MTQAIKIENKNIDERLILFRDQPKEAKKNMSGEEYIRYMENLLNNNIKSNEKKKYFTKKGKKTEEIKMHEEEMKSRQKTQMSINYIKKAVKPKLNIIEKYKKIRELLSTVGYKVEDLNGDQLQSSNLRMYQYMFENIANCKKIDNKVL